MRKYYQKILNEVFFKYLNTEQARMNLTDGEMADILQISRKTLAALYNGKKCCNALTLTLFLIYCTSPVEFLNELKSEYESRAVQEYSKEAISYRRKLPVSELQLCEADNGVYALCPRCGATLRREYVKFCSVCGQHICWSGWEKKPLAKR